MEVGTEVWVRSAAEVWAPGEVVDCQHARSSGVVRVRLLGSGEVVSRAYSEREDSEKDLYVRNKTRDFVNMASLTGLEHLHEPALLQALSERFAHDRIYTSIGDILVALNPLKDLDLYSQAEIDRYKAAIYNVTGRPLNSRRRGASQDAAVLDLPPHVFAIAGKAFAGLLKSDRRNQSILVSGESGSGKTESTKFLMRFLTSVGRDQSATEDSAGDVVEIGKRILQTNPILESFGNAQTIRNDNSSRFGKFIKIQFGERNEIVGAEIVSYLLEKVRLIHQSPGERSFHIFYELLEGMETERLESLGLKRGGKYELLNSYGPAFARRGGLGVKYKMLYDETVRAFEDTGVPEDERLDIFKILAALLHLGNVNFKTESTGREEVVITPDTMPYLKLAAELMGVETKQLKAILLSRMITAGTEVMVLKLTAAQAKDVCRSLAKAIYGRLFTWLVRRLSDGINYTDSRAAADDVDLASIGILDIFGFESLDQNGFEQLCINYANERLQAQFNEFVFIKEQQVYIAEGIDWTSVSYPSNAACLALFDEKANGLFSLLDQECQIPKGSDQALSTKYYRYHGSDGATDETSQSSQKYTLPQLVTSFGRYLRHSQSQQDDDEDDDKSVLDRKKHPFSASKMERVNHQFAIHHFAGKVCYSVLQFVEKNQDMLPTDASKILTGASNAVVVAIGDNDIVDQWSENGPGRRRYSMLRSPSVSSQFRSQLDRLLVEIGHTEPHYIRCLKPNEVKRPGVFDRERMVEQLRSVGVLEALRIARAGYSVRLAHATFVELFFGFRNLVRPQAKFSAMSKREQAQELVSVLMDRYLHERGSSNRSSIGALDADEQASRIAKIEARRRQSVQVGNTLVFCKTDTFNKFSQYRLVLRDRAALVIQKHIRGYRRRCMFQKLKEFAVRVQNLVRRCIAKKELAKRREERREVSATKIQKQCRMWLAECHRVGVQVQEFRMRRAFANFRRGCEVSHAEAEMEPSPSEDSVSESSKVQLLSVVKPSVVEPKSGSSSLDEDAANSAARLPKSGGRRRANSKVNARRQRLGSDTDGRNALLENEILRLQQLLVENKGQAAPPGRPRRSSTSSRPPKGLPHHPPLPYQIDSVAARPPRQVKSRRSYSVDGAEFSGDEGEEDDELSLLPPRRAQSVLPRRQQDHVSMLTSKIEELDAKCKFLEQIVAKRSLDEIPFSGPSRDSSMIGGPGWGETSSMDGSAYGDAPLSDHSDSAGVDSILANIQQQMNYLRRSIAAKEEVIRTTRKSHAMSVSSSTRPTRSSSIASSTSYSGLPGDAPPSLPSVTHSGSHTSGGMSPHSHGPARRRSSIGYPATPTGSYYQGTPRSSIYGGTPRSSIGGGGRAAPRIVKWARSNNCYECEEPFNLFVRRHHCRMCGNSFCHEHSSRRLSVFGIGFDDEPVRVCDACFADYYAAAQDPYAPMNYGSYAYSSTPLSTSSRMSAM